MKSLTLHELQLILRDALVGEELDDRDQHTALIEELARVVTTHFGGTFFGLGYRHDETVVNIMLDEEVPEDGGIYQHVATDVLWRDGREWIPVSKECGPARKLVIVGECDCPDEDMLVYHSATTGGWTYHSPRYSSSRYLWPNPLPRDHTTLQEFGFEVIQEGDRLICRRVNEGSAVYSDKSARKWQGRDYFELQLRGDEILC